MIQEFSIENFRSFRNRQTISFVASSDKHLSEELIFKTPSGVKLLRLAMIYGPNASGKSNFLKAIEAIWSMMFYSRQFTDERVWVYQPFQLCYDKPTKYEIVFWANNRQYCYILEHDDSTILFEELKYKSDKGVLSTIYKREFGNKIEFGTTITISKKSKDLIGIETLRNHTVISTLGKKNLDVPEIMSDLYSWIQDKVHEIGIHSSFLTIAEQATLNPELKKMMLQLLRKADFNISDFEIIQTPTPEEATPSDYPENIKVIFSHLNELKPKSFSNIVFHHNTLNEKFSLSYKFESEGTKTFFRLSRVLFELNSCDCLIMEDELDESLHYDLLTHFLQIYLHSKSRSQLLFTTHNLLLLSEDWLIRRDMIWLTEKDRETSSTILYRASDLGLHKNVSLMNAYRIGKLGAKPLLGSTYINNLD